MIIKQKVKFTKIDDNGIKHNFTVTICGRTEIELRGRVEKHINQYLHNGYLLR